MHYEITFYCKDFDDGGGREGTQTQILRLLCGIFERHVVNFFHPVRSLKLIILFEF